MQALASALALTYALPSALLWPTAQVLTLNIGPRINLGLLRSALREDRLQEQQIQSRYMANARREIFCGSIGCTCGQASLMPQHRGWNLTVSQSIAWRLLSSRLY